MAVEDAGARWVRFERTYWRLSHEARRRFDLECAESVAHLAVDPRVARLLAMRRAGVAQDELEPLREELYAARQVLRDAEDRDGQVAYRVGAAAYAATSRLNPALANSDYQPTAANEATNAIYIDVLRRTRDDPDAAEAARNKAWLRYLARLDELLAEP